MINHKIKVSTLSLIELVQAAHSCAAQGNINQDINAVTMPYSFSYTASSKKLLPQDAGKVKPIRSKELEEFLNKHDLDDLRKIAVSYGASEDAARLDIIRLIKRVAV